MNPEIDFIRIRKAIYDEGPNSRYHREKIRLVKRECPVLWAAIVSLIGSEPDWCQ